jgi:hypothetical protein
MTDPISNRFAPVPIGADLSSLSGSERQVLARLVDAARIMDALFLRQVWAGNETMLQRLARETSAAGYRRSRTAQTFILSARRGKRFSAGSIRCPTIGSAGRADSSA